MDLDFSYQNKKIIQGLNLKLKWEMFLVYLEGQVQASRL